MEWLDCSYNQLTTLDVSNNTALQFFDCRGNQLTELDITNNTELIELYCNNNKLISLDLSKNTKIVTKSNLKCEPQNPLTVAMKDGKTQFSSLPTGFDKTKVSDLSGGIIEGDAFKFTGDTITYKYDAGLTVEGEKIYIDATLKGKTVYDIIVEVEGPGSFNAPNQAFPGEEIKLYAFPASGYKFKEWQPVSPIGLTITDNKFTMPNEPVKVKAVFVPLLTGEHVIKLSNNRHGNLTSDKSVAKKGDEVQLTVTPDAGYRFKSWEKMPTSLDIKSDKKFTMPGSDVTVKAIFEKKPEHNITVNREGNGTANADVEKAYEGKEVKLTASAGAGYKVNLTVTPDADYIFKSWEKTPESLTIESGNTFIMPDENITIKAVFEKKPVTPPSGGGGIGIMLPPPVETDEVKSAKEAATKAVTELLKAETFSGEEQKKAEEIKKDFEEKLAKVNTAEEAKKLEIETVAAINALWSDGEISLKAKVESIGKKELIAKTRVVKTKKGAKAVRLSWNKVEGLDFDGYEIYRSTNKTKFGKTPIKTADGTKSSYLNTKNLRKGKTYCYKLKAFKMINGEKVYTGFSTKTWKTPKK